MYERLLKLIKENMPDADVENATPSSRLFEDLGMDSIGLMMLSMAMEDEFGVRLMNHNHFPLFKMCQIIQKNTLLNNRS